MADGDRTGSTFGRYELGELLGRGGMGEVYRAVDTEKDRTVALKLLPAALAADDSYVERFRRESRAVARLDEPHIIPIHDFGEIDGTLYLDMRIVDGADLRSTIRGTGKLAPPRVVAIIEQVGAALGAAHAAGIVHRDVKPENILLTPSDFAYLVDFGIAQDADTAQPQLTQVGTTVGSVAYIAPELFDDEEATSASDVYGLAVVAYEALTGRGPHPAATKAAAIKSALLDTPVLPSTLDPSLPVGFDDVLLRGLARDPAQRYAGAGEFAAAARAALDTGTGWSETETVAYPVPDAPPPDAPTWDMTKAMPAPVRHTGAQVGSTASPPPTGLAYGAYPSGSAYAVTPKSRGGNQVLIGVLAALVVVALGVGGYFAWSSLRGDSAASPPVTVTETTSAGPAIPPPDSVPCDTTVGVGTSVTSCPFAAAVRDAYLAAGAKGQARTVTAYSPVTGQSYSMSCLPEQGIVVCRGGNDAVVHIY
ncbi:serine/threonine protein kinase [Gordonia sp. X0973]|uniref:serine/threonine-protein kinase n=1 Tax=Gordonia sp. X0973 TaxID=2742602 RepID=UPI000F534EB5|nr:serine/threonine-protein kinase [Gordonia sp. X0973]QKT06548.1 serine/threonine protein kinase [Gordonia sp. X0973]